MNKAQIKDIGITQLSPDELREVAATFVALANDLDAAAEIERLAILESALRTIQSAVPKYLKKEMTAEEFALVCVGEVDNAKVNKALEKVK